MLEDMTSHLPVIEIRIEECRGENVPVSNFLFFSLNPFAEACVSNINQCFFPPFGVCRGWDRCADPRPED